MVLLDINPLIQYLRNRSAEEVEALPLEVPALPATITVGERLYETNLRTILRYLKQVNKACKREDPDSCAQVLTYRGVVKQFHDVDEWAFNTLVSLNMPHGVVGLATEGMTSSELRELFNASPVSPPVLAGSDSTRAASKIEFADIGSSVASQVWMSENLNTVTTQKTTAEDKIAFKFQGCTPYAAPSQSTPAVSKFQFRCASDSIYNRGEHSYPGQSLDATPIVNARAETQVPTKYRHVSAPVSRKESIKYCFLRLTGETLEEFVLGVEVEQSKLHNKLRWLLCLNSLQATAFLGRWPSLAKLRVFMRKHNLEWVIRAAGMWDVTPKSAKKRAAHNEAALEKFFSLTLPTAYASPIDEDEIKAQFLYENKFDTGLPNAAPTEHSIPPLSDRKALSTKHIIEAQPAGEEPAEEEIVEEEIVEDESCKEDLVIGTLPCESQDGDFGHVFPWLRPQQQSHEVSHDLQDSVDMAGSNSGIIKEPVGQQIGAINTHDVVEDFDISEGYVLGTASQTVQFAKSPATKAAACIKDEIPIVEEEVSILEAAPCHKQQELHQVQDAQHIKPRGVVQTCVVPACVEEDADVAYGGNLGHVFPCLRARMPNTSVDNSTVSTIEIVEFNVIPIRDAVLEDKDSGEAELPERFEYETDEDEEEDLNNIAPLTQCESNADAAVTPVDVFESTKVAVEDNKVLEEVDIPGEVVNTDSVGADPEALAEATEAVKDVDSSKGTGMSGEAGTTSEVPSNSSPVIPVVVLTKPDGTQFNPEAEPAKKVAQVERFANDPSLLAPSNLNKNITVNSAESATETAQPSSAPSNWSLAPIIAGLAISTIYVTARCPPLTAMAVTFWALTKMNRARSQMH